jgi:hypothetical protein
MLEKRASVAVTDSSKPVDVMTKRDLTRQVCTKNCLPRNTPATVIISISLCGQGSSNRKSSGSIAKRNKASCCRRLQYHDRDDDSYRSQLQTSPDMLKRNCMTKKAFHVQSLNCYTLLYNQLKKIGFWHSYHCGALQYSPR